MSHYTIGLEPWTDELWSELWPLAECHSLEVDEGVEPRRPFKLDLNLMRLLAQSGSLKVVVARKAHGRPVGYYTWNVTPDVESEGLLIAQQGAWFVEPGRAGVAVLMFDCAVRELKALGVKCIYPHHRTQGRGRDIGKFFRRRGAKLIQHTYSLWIGD